ncbi:TPA: acyl-CoA thioesterase, partial [Candidatus Azambacteria bacterium]|nr:acyl-CoA thioesterase [Candidatus Azambacteria bacterium]
ASEPFNGDLAAALAFMASDHADVDVKTLIT